MSSRYVFNVHYVFQGKQRGKGAAVIFAETAEQAEAAFRAEFPRTDRFDYKITKVIVDNRHL